MFKKIAILTGLFLALASRVPLVQAGLGDDNPQRPDIVGFGHDVSTDPIMGIDYDGNIVPGRNATYSVGKSTKAFKDVWAQAVHTSSPNVKCGYWHAPASSTVFGQDLVVSTWSLLGSPTTYTPVIIIQSSVGPRNVMIYWSSGTIGSGSGGGFSTMTLVGSATFYGYDSKGNWAVENVRFSTNHPVSGSTSTIAVDNTGPIVNYVGVGNVAWMQISSFTVQITSMTDAYGLNAGSANLHMRMYFGNRFGLPGNIDYDTDVLKVMEAGGRDVTDRTLNPAWSVNPLYDTISFQTQPGGGTNDDRSVCVNSRHSN